MEPTTAAATIATINAVQLSQITRSVGSDFSVVDVKELGARVVCNMSVLRCDRSDTHK